VTTRYPRWRSSRRSTCFQWPPPSSMATATLWADASVPISARRHLRSWWDSRWTCRSYSSQGWAKLHCVAVGWSEAEGLCRRAPTVASAANNQYGLAIR